MNNLIDIKKAYETTEFLDELFDRFEITNSNGEFDEYFSEINPTSLKTKLYAPIAEAIIYTAMCQNEEVNNTEPIIGVGKISDVMIVSEYRSDDNTVDCCVYDVKKQSVSLAGHYKKDTDEITPYKLDTSSKSNGIPMWLCIIQLILDKESNNELPSNELTQTLSELSKKINEGKEREEIQRLCFVASDYINSLTGVSAKAIFEVDGGIPPSKTFKKIKYENITRKEYAPKEVLLGSFELLDTDAKSKRELVTLEALKKEFSLDLGYTPEVPLKNYIVPPHLKKALRKIKMCANSATPAYNCMFIGTSGSGKTTAAIAMAEVLGVPYGVIEFDRNTDFFKVSSELIPKVSETHTYTDEEIEYETCTIYEEITGLKAPEGLTPEDVKTLLANVQTSGNGISYTELVSVLAENFEKPCVIEFKECLTAQNLTFLNGLLEVNGILTLASGKVLHRHPYCIIVATSNATYADVIEPDASFRARFMRNTYIIDTPTETELVERLEKNLSDTFPSIAKCKALLSDVVKLNTELERYEKENHMRNTVFGYLFTEGVIIEYASLYEDNRDITLGDAVMAVLPNAVSLTNKAKLEEIENFIGAMPIIERNYMIL